MTTPGDRIYEVMKAREISEGAVSRGTKIPQPTIHRIVTGVSRDPRRSNLEKIARFLGMSHDELYGAEPVRVRLVEDKPASERLKSVAEKLVALPPARQKLILQLIEELLAR